MATNQINWNKDISTDAPPDEKLAKTKDAVAVLIQSIIDGGNSVRPDKNSTDQQPI